MSNRHMGIEDAYNRSINCSDHSAGNLVGKKGDRKGSTHISESTHNVLRLENSKLKCELEEMRETIKQITSENSHEKFDERRINLIKFQTVQLERQVVLLTEALSSRQVALFEVENSMLWIGNKLRSLITTGSRSSVSMDIADIKLMLENLESSRIKLFKSLENSTKETTGKKLLLLNPFLKGTNMQEENISLLDISLQRMDYVNLRHVSLLESKLSTLYKELISLLTALNIGCIQGINLNLAEKKRVEAIVQKTSLSAKDVADDLLSLSLLCPSAPWAELKKPICQHVTLDRVKSTFPPLSQSKKEEVFHILESCINTCNHQHLLLQKKNKVLKEELHFHRSVYDLQLRYTQDLIDSFRSGYKEFETSMQSVCNFIKGLFEAYSKLKKFATEEALKEFLLFMKENESQITEAFEMLHTQDIALHANGAAPLTTLGDSFLGKINTLISQCQDKRDKTIQDKKEVQEQQNLIEKDLQKLIERLESKYNKQWPLNYQHHVHVTRKENAESTIESTPDNLYLLKDKEHSSIKVATLKDTEQTIYQNKEKTEPDLTNNLAFHASFSSDIPISIDKTDKAASLQSKQKAQAMHFPQTNKFRQKDLTLKSKEIISSPPVPLVAKRHLRLNRPKSLLNIDNIKPGNDFEKPPV